MVAERMEGCVCGGGGGTLNKRVIKNYIHYMKNRNEKQNINIGFFDKLLQ